MLTIYNLLITTTRYNTIYTHLYTRNKSVCLSVCLSVGLYPSVYLAVYLVSLSVRLSICVQFASEHCPPIRLPACLPARLSACPPGRPPVCLSACPPAVRSVSAVYICYRQTLSISLSPDVELRTFYHRNKTIKLKYFWPSLMLQRCEYVRYIILMCHE